MPPFEVLAGDADGDVPPGRLYKALVDNKKAVSANMGMKELHDPGYRAGLRALNDQQSLEDAKKAILDTMAGLVSEPPTKEEVDRAKTRILQGMEQQMAQLTTAVTDDERNGGSGDWRLLLPQLRTDQSGDAGRIVRVAKLYLEGIQPNGRRVIPDAAPDRTVVPPMRRPQDAAARITKRRSRSPKAKSSIRSASRRKSDIVRTTLPEWTEARDVAQRASRRERELDLELMCVSATKSRWPGKNAASQIAGALLMRGDEERRRASRLPDEIEKIDAHD